MSHPASVRQASAPEHGTRQHLVLLVAGLMVTMLLASLNQTVLSTALPTIVGELGGVSQMSWVITGYILATTVTMPIYGRISDNWGRRPVLIAAIAIFMAGSVVGAFAGDIWWLVAARGIQGIGGGGLMILSQAAIADVVPARERGKYMGAMGAVFAVSSVAGPLLGGWLTEGPGWRWAFWMNLPLGALAIVATMLWLKLPRPERNHRASTDYTGMALLAGATSSLVLVCVWGGHTYEWLSVQIIGLMVATVVLAALFVWVERRAAQPVIPMSLFADRNFTLTTVAGLLTGIAMFGALGYLPTYLQMVTGVNATEAGLLMTPMMGSLLLASLLSGQAVSRNGRYKAYPIVGTAIVAVGMGLMGTFRVDTPLWWMCLVMGIFGAGLGLSMQILTLIVQNAFPHSIVGTATAASNYFRQVGATVGSAVVGSVFVQRLGDILTGQLPAGSSGGGGGVNSLTPDAVQHLPAALRSVVVSAYNDALVPIFLWMVPLAIAGFIVLWWVREIPLATHVSDADITNDDLEESLVPARVRR